jgi:hypothetical protein
LTLFLWKLFADAAEIFDLLGNQRKTFLDILSRSKPPMALHIRALNNDTTFLLTFLPPIAPGTLSNPETFPGAFTILIDPWIKGPAQMLSSMFSYQERTSRSAISSLTDLPEPDIVLVTQANPDHCHKDSLLTLPAATISTILAPSAAAKKIKSWKYFDESSILQLPDYDPKKPSSTLRIEIPSFSPSTTPGELTITNLQAKNDVVGVHNGIGITYRPPHTILDEPVRPFFDVRPGSASSARSASPFLQVHASPQCVRSTAPSPINRISKAISVLYTPHGVSYNHINGWASGHLIAEAALPLTALVHALNVVDGPWFMGGNYISGAPSGIKIVQNLMPRVWIGAHDEQKKKKGIATKGTATEEWTLQAVRDKIQGARTIVTRLEAGQEWRIPAESKSESMGLVVRKPESSSSEDE